MMVFGWYDGLGNCVEIMIIMRLRVLCCLSCGLGELFLIFGLNLGFGVVEFFS